MELMGDKSRLKGPVRPGPSLSVEEYAEEADTPRTAADTETGVHAATDEKSTAASVLGALLLRRGDLDGAEPHLRAATAAGDRAAANNLGVLLHQRGYAGRGRRLVARSPPSPAPPPPRTRSAGTTASAATSRPRDYWLRQSAESGHAAGRVRARRPARTPRRGGSGGWFRAAAERGHREAAYRVAQLVSTSAERAAAKGDSGAVERRAAEEEAEQWYRQAAARGHRRAALQLGAILEHRGELKEAGRWYLTSAKDGEARAACALGFLLRDAGDEESAAVWWRRAAQDGDGNAANALGALHADRGERQTAERWYRAALDAGERQRRLQPRAALRRAGPYRAGRAVVPPCRLRRSPRGRQRARRPAAPARATRTGAEPWFSKAAEAGSVDAAFNLGILHAGPRRGAYGALPWYERAAAAGHTEAALQVGIALLRDGERAGRRAASALRGGRRQRRGAPSGSARCWSAPAAPRRAARGSGEPTARADRVRGVVRAGGRAGAPPGAGAPRHVRRGTR